MFTTALFRFFTLAVLAFAVQAGAAQPADDWNSVRSKNLSITGNASLVSLEATARRLENFRWAFSRLYPQFKLDNDRPTKIVIFKDAATYYEFLPKRPDGTTDVGVAGYFQPGDDVNYITFAVSGEQTDPLSTAVHEYLHSVLESNFDRTQLPPWINEGLAEYFETLRIENGRDVIVGSQQTEHLKLLRRSTFIPFPEFFAVTAADLKVMTPDRRRLYYAEAWAVVHTMIQSGQLSLNKLADGIAKWNGTNGANADGQMAVYGKLEQDLFHITRGSFPPASVAEQNEIIPTSDQLRIERMSAASEATILGDLLLHTGELTRSEGFLRQAVAADSDDADANGSFGNLLVREDKLAEARPYLQKAIAKGNANAVVLFNRRLCEASRLYERQHDRRFAGRGCTNDQELTETRYGDGPCFFRKLSAGRIG